jgi:transposase
VPFDLGGIEAGFSRAIRCFWKRRLRSSISTKAFGKDNPAPLFVAVPGASNYTYAEVSEDQRLASWIGAHVRTFEFIGGCPQLVVPDNTKTEWLNRAAASRT